MFEGSVSFVLPFYNAQTTLVRTIESVLQFSLVDFELVCVNDGSQDDSLAVVQNFSKRHGNIQVLSLEKNRGVSNARNTGIQATAKDFVFFIDSDDEIGPDFFENIEKPCDLIFGGHVFVNGADEKKGFDFGKVGFLDRTQIETLIRQYLKKPVGNSILTHCWAKLYKREFLLRHGLKFDTSISIYEDIKFVSSSLALAQNLFIHPSCVYRKNVSKGLGTKFYKAPLAFQDSLSILAESVSKSKKEKIELYDDANTYFIAKSLFLAKDLPISKIRKLVKDIRPEFSKIETEKISNPTVSRLFRWQTFRAPWLMAALLRFYGWRIQVRSATLIN
jgi:glycosyltransferase involved in cell wall biosynthesis